jgi:hypothetical protein
MVSPSVTENSGAMSRGRETVRGVELGGDVKKSCAELKNEGFSRKE